MPDSLRIKKSARRDSNPRPRPWQGRAPPTEPLARIKQPMPYFSAASTLVILHITNRFVNKKIKFLLLIMSPRILLPHQSALLMLTVSVPFSADELMQIG